MSQGSWLAKLKEHSSLPSVCSSRLNNKITKPALRVFSWNTTQRWWSRYWGTKPCLLTQVDEGNPSRREQTGPQQMCLIVDAKCWNSSMTRCLSASSYYLKYCCLISTYSLFNYESWDVRTCVTSIVGDLLTHMRTTGFSKAHLVQTTISDWGEDQHNNLREWIYTTYLILVYKHVCNICINKRQITLSSPNVMHFYAQPRPIKAVNH